MLTGRYQLRPTMFGRLRLYVEDHANNGGFNWRAATKSDLAALEPMVADGYRFPEERNGTLGLDGKRYKDI